MHFKHKRDCQQVAEEIMAWQALTDLLTAIPVQVVEGLAQRLQEQKEASQVALDAQLASDNAARAKILDGHRDAIVRDAKMKYMAAQYTDMARMNQDIDQMTEAFKQKQAEADARFIQRCYGQRIK